MRSVDESGRMKPWYRETAVIGLHGDRVPPWWLAHLAKLMD